jgi:hypothetical protein
LTFSQLALKKIQNTHTYIYMDAPIYQLDNHGGENSISHWIFHPSAVSCASAAASLAAVLEASLVELGGAISEKW